MHKLGYAFGLMFTQPDLHLRPAAPISGVWHGYLLLMRGEIPQKGSSLAK